MKRRKIAVLTTSRADFGLLTGLLKALQADPAVQLQLLVSGMHLCPNFGETWKDIAAEGLRICRKVPMLLAGDSSESNAKAVGLAMAGFTDAFAELKPDILVLLGDRFELLAAAVPALLLRIPMAHIHGGERSEGAIDEAVRHAITKMASVHFPATESYRQRILQMGEAPARVLNFGAPGLDRLYSESLLTRADLESVVGLSFKEPVGLVTYHPATLEVADPIQQVRYLVAAIRESGIKAVFTAANADAQGARINVFLSDWCAAHPDRFKWIPHLGHIRFLSCLRHCALMIGNSSSGLTEAPSFELPVVNIGLRQKGRVRALNVIDVSPSRGAIVKGIKQALSPRFRKFLQGMRNPYDRYGDGSASFRIKEALKTINLAPETLAKSFHDIPTYASIKSHAS